MILPIFLRGEREVISSIETATAATTTTTTTTTVIAATSGSITTTDRSFDAFVQQGDFQSIPQFDKESLKQNPRFAHGGVDHNKVYAMYAAKNISSLKENAVALNQTINTAIVALAEQDPNDPHSGRIHYVAFVQGRDPRTYVFTENITINPDGTIKSQMEQAQGWNTGRRRRKQKIVFNVIVSYLRSELTD